MGCFVSTNKSNNEEASKNNSSSSTCSRGPPPTNPLIEEETVVKEVLSETPSHSKLPISRFSNNGSSPSPSPSPKNPIFSSPNARLHKPHYQNSGSFKNPRLGFNSRHQSGDLSEEASEICSSLSESCERKNIAEVDDDVNKIRVGSPGKYRNGQVARDRSVGNSPCRRTQASPGRSRSGSRGDGNGLNNVRRIGSEMGQGRRSPSPATRVDATSRSMSGSGRCPSARRLSSGRVGSTELVDKTRAGDDDVNYRNRDSKLALSNNESLENPLVSLECFIFL